MSTEVFSDKPMEHILLTQKTSFLKGFIEKPIEVKNLSLFEKKNKKVENTPTVSLSCNKFNGLVEILKKQLLSYGTVSNFLWSS